jgi:putative ABC transport system permease protein
LIHGGHPSINALVMTFSMLVSIAASVLFGLAPALETSRIDLTEALKEGSRGSTLGRRLLRESMVAFEVCASLVLLIGAALLVRSFIGLERTSPGFRSENVLVARISLPVAQYPEPTQRNTFARSLLERMARDPWSAIRRNGRLSPVQRWPGKWRGRIRRASAQPSPHESIDGGGM